EKIKLPLPWKQGEVLRYETERVQTETGPGKREKSIGTSKAAITTLEARKDGFVQQWTWSESKEEVLEGDKSMQQVMAEATAKLEKIPLVVEMNADGNYTSARNLADIGQQMIAVMRPMLVEQVDVELQKQAEKMDAAQRAKARDESVARLDAFLKRFTEPKVMENLLTKDIQNVLAFTGADLENDQAYELETELENPTGGANFPGKLTFGLYVDEESPEDVWLEWTLAIDPVKGAAAVWDTVERLYGRKINDAERKELPAEVSIVDKGFIVFERATGVPELYQNERTTKFGENANYERSRMRLLGGGHDHVWLEQNPQATEPALTSDERDAQLCADDKADGQAAIAACSRALEHKALAPAKRAEWYAQRAWHRDGLGQKAEAIADFGKAIDLVPDEADYHLWRSSVKRRNGDDQGALVDADRAIALDPKWAYARMIKAFAHEAMDEWSKAVDAYDEAIALAPREADYHDGRCWARAMTGDYAGGKTDCDRALELDAKSWNSYDSRAYIHYRLGEHAKALADADKGIEHAPKVGPTWYVRGLAKRALGDAKGAEADIAKALALDPKVAERYAGYGVK
ncbi:MAG TPA: tetratricopeptide repeat protein, partial [Thermomonas sp.]|nr:tetratricopeptide repeat protein [Thermomonas sp.]